MQAKKQLRPLPLAEQKQVAGGNTEPGETWDEAYDRMLCQLKLGDACDNPQLP